MALARTAQLLLQEAETVSIAHYDAAAILLDQALRLAPEDVELWRQRRAVAQVANEAERLGSDVLARSSEQIARLDPTDQVMRLWLLSERLEKHQIMEDRADALRDLLKDQAPQRLGPAVAAHLALDLARMYSRAGDVDAYQRWLGTAMQWDRSNVAATAEAVGFFAAGTDDPFAEAELLVSLLLAAPADVATQTELAHLLLDHGAFRGAARLLGVAQRHAQRIDAAVEPELIVDLAIAMWASGEGKRAYALIERFQHARDTRLREQRWLENQALTRSELTAFVAPRDPTLATVKAAIALRAGVPESDAALTEVIAAYELALSSEPEHGKALQLELAWAAAWLGAPATEVDRLLQPLNEELNDQARRRFEGWTLLREGDPAAAIAALSELPSLDTASRFVLGEARLAAGADREAARDLLAVAREQPGTLIGVWATDRLAELLGRRVPISELARRLEDLLDAVPLSFDRYPIDPTLAVSVRIDPDRARYGPLEPLRLHVEIANNSPFPLAVDEAGPIRPALILQFDAGGAWGAASEPLAALVLDLDRRLRLNPRERLVIPIDLRRTEVGRLIERAAVNGWTLRADVTLNPMVSTDMVVRPYLLGSRDQTPTFRVEGVRVSEQWADESLQAIATGRPDATLIALLAQVACDEPGGPQSLPLARCAEVADALLGAWPRIEPVDQAWLLLIMPRHQLMGPILALARQSEDRLVRLAYLIAHLQTEDDPMIDAARRSGDEILIRFADTYSGILFGRGPAGL